MSEEIVVRRGASDDPRTLARDGLVGLGFSPQEADGMLEEAAGSHARGPDRRGAEGSPVNGITHSRGRAHPGPGAARRRGRARPLAAARAGSRTSSGRSA